MNNEDLEPLPKCYTKVPIFHLPFRGPYDKEDVGSGNEWPIKELQTYHEKNIDCKKFIITSQKIKGDSPMKLRYNRTYADLGPSLQKRLIDECEIMCQTQSALENVESAAYKTESPQRKKSKKKAKRKRHARSVSCEPELPDIKGVKAGNRKESPMKKCDILLLPVDKPKLKHEYRIREKKTNVLQLSPFNARKFFDPLEQRHAEKLPKIKKGLSQSTIKDRCFAESVTNIRKKRVCIRNPILIKQRTRVKPYHCSQIYLDLY